MDLDIHFVLFYNNSMPITLEIAQKIVKFLTQWSGKKLERKHKVLKILKVLHLTELKGDIESVYAHALVEYAVDANPAQLTLLFADKTVKQAFQQDLLKNRQKQKEFEKTLDELLCSGSIPIVPHIYKTAADLKPEIERFKEFYDYFTLQTATAFQLKQYNEWNRFVMKSWEKSFDFQAEQYLIRLRDVFQKEFLDKNHYIDLNGETRVEKKGKGYGEGIDIPREIEKEKRKEGAEKRVDYESIVYKPLDSFIHEWLKDDNRNFLVIVGEYGTGKTTFLRHLAHQMASFRLEPGLAEGKDTPDEKYRMPLYFPLRDFERKMEPYIVDQFSKEGITDIDFPGFLRRMADDEMVVLLDGFDEMTRKIDPDEKSRNFEKIRRLIDSTGKSKIILTVRQEYFQSAAEIEAVFRHRDKANYQFLHLLPFDDDQIRQYLETHTTDPEYYWEQIETVFDLHDLAKRPVLLQLIVDYLPKVIEEKGKNEPIAASDLYDKCIQEEMRRKSSELDFIIPNKYRTEILEKLAIWMFANDQLSFDTGLPEIWRLIKHYFKTDKEWEYEKYLNEFLTFSFLIREADYQYRMSHKSFRDYLTARSFVGEINTGKIEHFAANSTTEEINHFIKEQGPDVKVLLDLVLTARDLSEENQWQGTNAANILLKIDKTLLKNRDLSRCRLAFVDFRGCDLTGTNFREADLGNCVFNKTVLSAQFRDTNVANSLLDLSYSKIKNISFLKEFKNLSHLDLGRNQLTDISPLKDLKNLTTLWLNHNQLTDISPLKELKNLNDLDLSDNQLTDISPIQELKNLTTLWLNNNQLTDISPLKELKNLTTLWLNNNQLTDISSLKELKNLTTLWLNNNQLTDISSLKELTNLTTLWLHNNQLTDISSLKELKNLTDLNLSNNQLTDISPLKEFKNLTDLRLYYNQLTDISPLKELKNLTYLRLYNNQLTDISPLKELKNLTTLWLNNNQITDISTLKELKQLEYLYLQNNQLSKNQITALKEALPNLKILEV